MTFDYQSYLDEVAKLIKDGEITQARNRLIKKFKTKKVPRNYKAQLTNLLRRSGAVLESLKVLYPVIREKSVGDSSATQTEIIEYAASLIAMGATNEGIDLLQMVDGNRYPQALFFRASALFKCWDYQQATPILEKYVENPQLDSYKRLIGEINLATAYLHEKNTKQGLPLLENVISEAHEKNLKLLSGMAYMVRGQSLMTVNKLDDASDSFDKAKTIFVDDLYSHRLHLVKWEKMLETKQSQNESMESLKGLRQEATRKFDWETLRSIDEFQAIETQNDRLFVHLYYGTPFPRHRENLLNNYRVDFQLPEYYLYNNSGESAPLDQFFDLNTGKTEQGKCLLRPGKLPLKMLNIFCNDFYKRKTILQLFNDLFPGEYYNPFCSSKRVLMNINRVNKKFKKVGLPLTVKNDDGFYYLKFEAPINLKIIEERDVKTSLKDVYIEKLQNHWDKGSYFTNKEFSRLLGLGARHTSRIINDLCYHGFIQKYGAGPSTNYRVL